jgi:phage-related protein
LLAIVLTYTVDRIIQFYRTAVGRCPVEELLDELDNRTLSKVLAVFKLIETQPIVPSQFFKKLSGHELWECRVGLGGRIYRFLGFRGTGALIILTHGFQKKTQKTPQKEIKKALDLKANWQRRKQ